MNSTTVNVSVPSRDLIRCLRVGLRGLDDNVMPESIAWRVYLELRRRGEPRAGRLFVGALRNLHTRRSIAGSDLCVQDIHTEEHRLIEDAYLADLWKAYKKCIKANRTGPASQLLRDIEEQVTDC